jgi:hypothetical protein
MEQHLRNKLEALFVADVLSSNGPLTCVPAAVEFVASTFKETGILPDVVRVQLGRIRIELTVPTLEHTGDYSYWKPRPNPLPLNALNTHDLAEAFKKNIVIDSVSVFAAREQ